MSKDIITKTHSGAKSKFFQEFVLTKKVAKELGELFSDLQDWRQESDYADFIEFNQETVEPVSDKVREFIQTLEKLV